LLPKRSAMVRRAAVPKFVVLRETLLFTGAFNAAERSRTSTPREGHKALKLTRRRLLERKTAYRAKSIPAESG
jgi:hypothetical protein